MATITSHTLNGVDGSHASSIPVRLINRASGEIVFQSEMDEGGRLIQTLTIDIAPMQCELVFETAAYWAKRGYTGAKVISEIVLRFAINGPDDSIHMPVILSPFSYSTWKSD